MRRSLLAARRNMQIYMASAESVPPPAVTSFTPTTRPATGGTFALVGTGFLKMRQALLDTQVLAHSVADDQHMTITAGVQSLLEGYVIVETRGGQVYPPQLVTFTPVLTSLLPVTGPAAGGTSVVLTGAGFATATDVTIDGNSVAFVINSNTQITATTAAHAVGAVDVAVTNPNGTATLVAGFTFV